MHNVIFSHGFGVQATGRGMFTDLMNDLPGVTPVMFDYNRIDPATNTLYASPLQEQAEN